MRISDWSSDVCSSDLAAPCDRRPYPCGRIAAACGLSLPAAPHGGLSQRAGAQRIDRPGCLARHRYRPDPQPCRAHATRSRRSEEHTSELQSLMRISYAVFCLKKKKKKYNYTQKYPSAKQYNDIMKYHNKTYNQVHQNKL